MWIVINKINFVTVLGNCTHKNREKADSEASAKWKEIKEKPDNINELGLKTKADLKI